MEEDKELVDEFERLTKFKKELDEKLEFIRTKIISLATQKNTDILFGTSKKCSIKSFDKVIYPEDKTLLVELIKKKGLYEQFSSVNYLKLGPRILKNEVDPEIVALVKKEKGYRVSLFERGI